MKMGIFEQDLYNVTYDCIYMILELIDGYRGMQIELIDTLTQLSISEGIELYVKSPDYLKCF